jgi:hypothetical protein
MISSRFRRRVADIAAYTLAALATLTIIGGPSLAPSEDRTAAEFEIAQSGRDSALDMQLLGLVRRLASRVDDLGAGQDRLATELRELEDFLSATATAYRNMNGKVDRDDRHLGPATFIVPADRQGKPTSLELDHALMLQMCGDVDGCLATLGLTGVVVAGEEVEAMFTGRPCGLHLDATEGAWALSGSCASADLPLPEGEAPPGTGHPAWGRDGDATPLDGARQEARLILSFAGACFLAEAAPKLRSGTATEAQLNRDVKRDLFLLSGGTEWDPTGEFPGDLLPMGLRDPTYQCRLTVRD